MSITAFWSPLHGTSATCSMLAVAVCMAEGHDKPTIVTQTHFSLNNLEQPLIGRTLVEEKRLRAGKGIDALKQYVTTGALKPELVESVVFDISEKLLFLPGTRQEERELYELPAERERIKNAVTEVGRVMSGHNVLIDTNAGEGAMTKCMLELADNIVVSLRQNKAMIDLALNNELLIELSQKKNVYFCFSSYDDMSKLNLFNIPKMFKALPRNAIGAVPYNTGYADAISDCDALRFLTNTIGLYDPKDKDADDWWWFVDELTRKIL